MASKLTAFTGTVPYSYDTYLGPLLFQPYANDLASRLGTKDNAPCLELACGTGILTAHLVRRRGSGRNLVAVDLNPDMLNLAKQKLRDPFIRWEAADAEELPFADASFDTAVCQFGIMFFADKRKALQEACRVLRPGGRLLFNTWDSLEHNPGARLVQTAFAETFPDAPPDFINKGPFSFFDQDTIMQLAVNAGFAGAIVEKVPMTGKAAGASSIVEGFVRGTPLATYLQDKPVAAQCAVRDRLFSLLVEAYGPGEIDFPMQAIVIDVTKA